MVRVDFKCRACGGIVTLGGRLLTSRKEWQHREIEDVECEGVLDRVWSAPHMGAMSSGEPPR